jgi:hypothetical protein
MCGNGNPSVEIFANLLQESGILEVGIVESSQWIKICIKTTGNDWSFGIRGIRGHGARTLRRALRPRARDRQSGDRNTSGGSVFVWNERKACFRLILIVECGPWDAERAGWYGRFGRNKI